MNNIYIRYKHHHIIYEEVLPPIKPTEMEK